MSTPAPASKKRAPVKPGAARKASALARASGKRTADIWDEVACQSVIEQLWNLRGKMLAYEASLAPFLVKIDPGYQASARNLAHYLKLRKSDRRPLQEWLAQVGLSSLGRAESDVLANLDKVLGILHRLTGQPWQAHSEDEPVGINSSRKLLERHTTELLGVQPSERAVRIMVTLPSEAAGDYGLIRRLVHLGDGHCPYQLCPRWP